MNVVFILMKVNPSQYNGTLKITWCSWCHQLLNTLNADQQRAHGILCKKQTKLFDKL
jgi:hypothetical protein